MKFLHSICIFGLSAASLSAQFITPTYRNGDSDANFAYWEGFDVAYTAGEPPYSGLDETQVNYPYSGGNTTARLGQYGAPSAIITSSLSIYSFSDNATAFNIYDNPTYSPGDILFQTKTLSGSQSTPDFSTVKLFYRSDEGTGNWQEADIPVTAAVNSSDSVGNQYTAWEWDTSGLEIAEYFIQFAYELAHSALVEAQLDTHETFDQQLDGFGLDIQSNVPFGLLFGIVERSPEKLIYNDGEEVTIEYRPNGNFEFVKWVGPFGESTENPVTVTITDDTEIQLVTAATTYEIWRQTSFASNHGGGITPADWAADNDYDQDSLLNILEYALNTDPESGLAGNQVTSVVVNVDGVDYPALEFPQQVAAEDLTYSVSVSGDLDTWFTNGDAGGPYTSAPEILSLGDDGEQYVRVRALTPLDAPASLPFMQLNVSYED